VDQHDAAADQAADGRLTYLAQNLTSLHGAADIKWLAGRFEFLGEHSLGATLTALVLPDEGGAYRALKSASPRPASAQDLWTQLALDRISSSAEALAALQESERSPQPRTFELTAMFGEAAAGRPEVALVTPLTFNRELIGAGLFLLPPPDETATTIAGVIASHAAVAIYQLRGREEARRLHSIDPRLWVPDEDFLIAQLRREVARARRYGRELGVALLRLENEHEARTKFGDFYADHLMRRIGGQLVASVRDTDVLGALHGAYAVLHTDTGPQGTKVSAHRLREAVVKMLAQRFPEAPAPVFSVRTVSCPEHSESVEALIEHLESEGADTSSSAA
jgi:GGDEF domain-containing protein